MALTVALYYILERFEYHICVNNFSVGKCLSHSTRYKVNIKHLQHETTYGKTFSGPKCRCSGNYGNRVYGGRVGLLVRALVFHHCGPGSISALGVICGLSVLVLYAAMRGFSPGTPVFPSHQKPTFDFICELEF